MKLQTEKELKKYLNNYGLAKYLKFFAKMLCDKNFKFKLNYGGGSYTDYQTVTIGIPKYMVGHTKEELLAVSKALTAHEIEHINSTPEKEYQEFITKFGEYFKEKYDINEITSEKAGQYIINSLEDGRIERLACSKFPGIKRNIVYCRSLWWKDNSIEKANNELMDTLFCLCTFATMGLFPKGYAEAYKDKEELYDMIRGIKRHIVNFVNSNKFSDGVKSVWELVYEIEEWMAECMKNMPEEELDDLLDEANEEFSEIQEGSGKEDGSYENDESNQEEAESEENQNSEEAPASDAINSLSDLDKEEISDKTMEEIINEGIKNAEEEIREEEYNNVIQADYDDLIEKNRKAKEKEKEEGVSEEERENLLNYYRNLPASNRDGNWDLPLKFYKYNYDKVDAPQSIKLEAKKLEKEFNKIFLNKKTVNAKNRKRGMLDTNSLWKIQNKDYNIFKKKGEPNETDYVFYVLVDGSGSMYYDNKFEEAYRATSLLEESLGGFVPLKIVQFDCTETVNHYIVKDFEERRGNLSWAFVNNNEAGSSNMDGYSIRVALKDLSKRPEKNKVLIVLSDGQPAGYYSYYGGRAQRDVKEAIREGRKAGVSIFNIMFGKESDREQLIDSFKFMYEKGIISCPPKQIGNELLRVVKRELNK